MKQLTRAYHVLSNLNLRELYDEQRGSKPPLTHHEHHTSHPVAFTHVRSPVPPGVGAPTPSVGGQDTKDGGGGFGFAILCFILALCCVSILIHGQSNFFVGALFLLGTVLFTLGGMLFLQDGSVLNRTVYAWLNGEPKQFRQQRWRAEQMGAHGRKPLAHQHLTPFEALVQEAMSSLPDEFQEQMGNMVLLVEPAPDDETLDRVGRKEGYILLGLYQGVPLTKQGMHGQGVLERITIYQKNIETYCHDDPDRIRAQVQKTVLHEVAHHFGIDHNEMPIWVK